MLTQQVEEAIQKVKQEWSKDIEALRAIKEYLDSSLTKSPREEVLLSMVNERLLKE